MLNGSLAKLRHSSSLLSQFKLVATQRKPLPAFLIGATTSVGNLLTLSCLTNGYGYCVCYTLSEPLHLIHSTTSHP